MNIQEQVVQFHKAFDHPIADRPTVIADDRVRLRARLIAEEALETISAMFDLEAAPFEDSGPWQMTVDHLRRLFENLINQAPVKVDLVELADGLADLDYVVEGTRLEFGIEGGAVAAEIHVSNLAKRHSCPDCDGRGECIQVTGAGYNFDVHECPSCKGTGAVHKKRADGKTLKPEGWTAPNIRGVLELQSADPGVYGLKGRLREIQGGFNR